MGFDWPGEKFLIKLCDTLGNKGSGCLRKPWQMRREGAAVAEIKRLDALTAAQTKLDAEQIKSGKKLLLPDGKLQDANFIPADGNAEAASRLDLIAELEDIVKTSIHNEAFRKEISVAKAILYAEQELAQETQEPPEQTVEDDWLFRWRDNASSVSSEELQSLWGKVLAGEVKNPGAFSLRTLDFLRNLSRHDATLIEKVAPFVIKGIIVRPETPTNEPSQLGEVAFAELLELQDLGILSGVEAIGLTTKFPTSEQGGFSKVLTCHGRVLLITHPDASRILALPVYLVTKLGQEVLSLGWKSANEQYLLSVANRIKKMDYEVQIGNYIKAEGEMINCYNLVSI